MEPIITKLLKYSPVKYTKKLPDKLFWHNSGMYHDISAFSTYNPNQWAKMVCREGHQYIKGKAYPSLFIDLLLSHPPKKGLGKAMIKFAINFSKKLGYEGRVHLAADSCFAPNEIPHIFYRKCGFTTCDMKTDKKLDKFIKKGKTATHNDFKTMLMCYPSEPYIDNNKPSIIGKMLDIFKCQK